MKDLAEVMRFTCQCLTDVRYHTKIKSAKDSFVPIMTTLRDAAIFINSYSAKSRIGQLDFEKHYGNVFLYLLYF